MKAVVRALFLYLLLLGSAGSAFAADTYKVDAGHTVVVFQVTHLNVSNFYGRFNETEGQIIYDAAKPENSSIEFRIKTESVDTNSEKRDKHLKGPDFFNVKQFPIIQFRSKSVKAQSDGNLEVAGEATMLGVTRPLTVRVEKIGEGKDPWGGHRIGFEAKFSLKRSDFGMKYNLKGLGDEVKTTVAIEGIKQ
mgnify:CR=1 FL=1